MKLLTRSLCLFVLPVVLGLAATANAQPSCNECDPYYSYCDQQCWWCDGADHPDGYCEYNDVAYSTCGDYMGACLPWGCAPNWHTTSRQNVGTYGSSTYGWFCTWGEGCSLWTSCDHHRVDRVTEHDFNQCNINAAYWDRQSCDDWVDASKPWKKGWPAPDCCDPIICMEPPDPRCFYDSTYTCNDWHSCF